MSSKTLVLFSSLLLGCCLALPRTPRQADLKLVGPLKPHPINHHSVSGDVYLKGDSAIVIKDFNYDGIGAAIYFKVATTGKSRDDWIFNNIFLEPDEGHERKYTKETVEIKLPAEVNAKDIKWFTVWCETFGVSFGEVRF